MVGRSNNVPDGLTPASDVATLSLFGYDPLQVYTGRAPLETAATCCATSCSVAERSSKTTLSTRHARRAAPSRPTRSGCGGRAKRRAFRHIPEAVVAAYEGLPGVLVWDVEKP